MFSPEQQLALVAELREVRHQRDAAGRDQARARQEYEAHRAAYRNVVERYRTLDKRFEAIMAELLDGESAYPLLEGTVRGPQPEDDQVRATGRILGAAQMAADRMNALFQDQTGGTLPPHDPVPEPPRKRGRPKRDRPDTHVATTITEEQARADPGHPIHLLEQPAAGPSSLPEALQLAMQLPEVYDQLASARQTGCTDAELRAVLGRWPTHCWRPWGQGPGIAWAVRGGDNPAFYLGADTARYPADLPTLGGRDLVKAVRKACAIRKATSLTGSEVAQAQESVQPGRRAFVEQPTVWDEDSLCDAAAALDSAVAEVVVCNRCGSARRRALHPCPKCRNPEYRTAAHELAEIARGVEAARG